MFIDFYQSPDRRCDPRFRACPTDVIQAGNLMQEHRSKIYYTLNVTVYPRRTPRYRDNIFIKDKYIIGLRLGRANWVNKRNLRLNFGWPAQLRYSGEALRVSDADFL